MYCLFLLYLYMAKRENLEDYVGKKFTYLTVIKEGNIHITKGNHKHRTIFCKCDCGVEKDFQFSAVKSGLIKSCGCYSAKMVSERMKKKMKTHGRTLTSEYYSWMSMKKRCLNDTHKSYKSYGGRGISICSRWENSFENFFEDMGVRPGKNYSLDRINNNLGYCKENCRWATKKEQSRNIRTNVLITYKGQTKCISEWAESLGVSRSKISYRIMEAKWDIEKALTYEL